MSMITYFNRINMTMKA